MGGEKEKKEKEKNTPLSESPESNPGQKGRGKSGARARDFFAAGLEELPGQPQLFGGLLKKAGNVHSWGLGGGTKPSPPQAP